MKQPAKIAMPASANKARTYHFHVQPQKNRPGSAPRYMLIYSDTGRPIDMDSDDDEDYNTMNIGRADLDRLFVATLRAYGVSINVDEVAKFQMNARVAPGLHDDVETLTKEVDLLQQRLKTAEATIKQLRAGAPVLSVNGKVGHVVLTRDDIAENSVEGNPIPSECGVESVQGKVGHVHLTADDLPEAPTSQLIQNILTEGMRVLHPRFGAGTVRSVQKPGRADMIAEIDFDKRLVNPKFMAVAVSGLQIIRDEATLQPTVTQPETLTFDETDHPDEETPVKLQHLTYLIPEGVCVTRFIPRSLGLLCCPDGAQYPLYTDMHIIATNPDGSTVDEVVRFVSPNGQDRVTDFVEKSTPYTTVALMVKES